MELDTSGLFGILICPQLLEFSCILEMSVETGSSSVLVQAKTQMPVL